MRNISLLLLVLLCSPCFGETTTQVATTIDQLLENHWQSNNVTPAEPADDATFLRRITLDLAGRIPTPHEVDTFLKDKSSDKRQRLIESLVASPEFALNFGNVLDQFIQDQYAGDTAFIDYLRRGLRENKSWDKVFRELMLGPWTSDNSKPANRFIDKRAKELDRLTVDAARVFFGVDISCAKCHDHPLVDEWKQDHFYGMAAFFNRTTGGKGNVGEKNEGEVKFLASDGNEKVAKMMFLSGRVVDEPDATAKKDKVPPLGRREQLVNVALEDPSFFSRAIVNRLWEYFFGRGLVSPTDQMHLSNPSAVPGLLEWLADDFSGNGYDLRRLVAAIVSCRAYQLDSAWKQGTPIPDADLFAVARLRPLTRHQLAFSLLLASGNARFDNTNTNQLRAENILGASGFARVEQYLAIEQQARELAASIDPRSREFQSSADEALFMSNNEAAQKLVTPGGESTANLTDQLAKIGDDKELATAAIRQVLSRPANVEEVDQLVKWIESQKPDRAGVCQQLVWALLTSAEFRFNH